MKTIKFIAIGLKIRNYLRQTQVTAFISTPLWGLGGLLFYSCNSGVEINRINPSKLIAVSSFISPQDSVVKVYVSKARALGEVLNSNTAVITDAQVNISDGVTIQNLTFDIKTQSYLVSTKIFKIVALKTYQLNVKTQGISVSATCQVPPVIQGLSLDGVRADNNYVFSFNWKFPENLRYFFFDLDVTDVVFVPKLGQSSGPSIPIIRSYSLTDRNDISKNAYLYSVSNAFLAEKVSLKTTVYGLDENAYKYLKTRNEANNYGGNTNNFFPNLQEPQPIFSNIQGGVGVFGAFNKAQYVTVIK